jgi:hypothetical protein
MRMVESMWRLVLGRAALALLGGVLLTAAGPARAVTVELSTDVAGCTGYAAGLGLCNATGETQITVTWSLQSQTALTGYQLEVRWDPGELTLLQNTQLFPDTGVAGPFLIPPNDPNDSIVTAIIPPPAELTTALFSMTFSVDPDATVDAQADVAWFATNDGLSPRPPVMLENKLGSGIDVYIGPDVPAMDAHGVGLVGLLLACSGIWLLRREV